MSAVPIRQALLESLRRVAPEADFERLDPELSLREQLELDSMDFLHFLVALHERLGVDVPEAEVAQLATLAGAERYLTAATRTSNARRTP